MNRPFRSFQPREPKHRRNGKIRAREVRVIDEAKSQLGVMPLGEALRLAQRRGLDLIETVPNAVPPVCRIAEYGKLLYEEAKRSKESESRRPAGMMKEIQLTPGIDTHDFDTKAKHAMEFLDVNMKVRVKLRFKGRQRAHKEFGFAVMNRFVEAVAAHGQPDAPPRMLGDRDLNMVISPKSRRHRAEKLPSNGVPGRFPGVAPSSEQAVNENQ